MVTVPQFTSDWFSHNIPAWESLFGSLGWDPLAPKTIVEIGSYEGRSSIWMLDHLLQNEDSRLYCIDVFAAAYAERFRSNIAERADSKKVSIHASASFDFFVGFLASSNRADFIYIDGSHRAADVLEDLILAFRALKPSGLIICDDYLGGAVQGNDLTLGSPKIAVDAFTTIFRDRISIFAGQPLYQLAFRKIADRADDDPTSRGQSAVQSAKGSAIRKRKVFDCFMYNGEADVLSIRLHELSDVVDVFVLAEADATFSGQPREISYDAGDERFSPFRDRIRHVVVRDMPDTDDPWRREAWQRDALMRGLGDAAPDDLVFVSDVDEIPRASVVLSMRASGPTDRPCGLRLALSYFFLNYCVTAGPDNNVAWTIAASRSAFDTTSPHAMRSGVRTTTISADIVYEAGWHFSYLFDLPGVRRKIGQFSHQEYNTREFLDAIDIERLVERRGDLFGERGNFWDITSPDNLPQFVKNNREKFGRFILQPPRRDEWAVAPAKKDSKPMQFFETVAAEAPAFHERLKTIKAEHTDVSWYPYDTMGNFPHMQSLVTEDTDLLFDGNRRFADIGAADGDSAFYLESRGNACDIYDFGPTNFNNLNGARTMRQALNSKVGINEADLDSQFKFSDDYDVTFLLGIVYHLKNPFFVLERLSYNTKVLFLSTKIVRHFRAGSPDVSDFAAAYLVGPEECNNDPTNYWMFTTAGLKRILSRTGWEIVAFKTVGDTTASNPQRAENDERAFALLKSSRT